MSNHQVGRDFQLRAKRTIEMLVGETFDEEVAIGIGNPPRPHKFDLVSKSRLYVAECKAFTYTASGNNPSAKITTLREALQYLNILESGVTKLLVMNESRHADKRETLAEYFARLNGHLAGNVTILEIDAVGQARVIAGKPPAPSAHRTRL